jgi:epoxyqueuosine reductase
MDFVSALEPVIRRYGFDQFGWTPLERPLSIEIYRDWLDKGHHASMEYLRQHEPLKEQPQKWAPRARSALVVARRYFPHPYAETELPLGGARVALYAQGEDYHLRFKGELEKLAAAFKADFPAEEFLCFTDSAPILERDLAYRAGLGWIGKNTCLIHPKNGSLFFLGQILTSLPIAEKATPLNDFCGTCDRCLRACPTGALEAPRWLNAGKCISFWTIESRATAPMGLREQTGDWFFGCDICQTVCPWNEKAFGRETMQRFTSPQEDRAKLVEDLRWLLRSSHREISRRLRNSPLLRARPLGLKRNALVVLGNRQLHELKEDALAARQNADLKEVAEWALAQLRLTID